MTFGTVLRGNVTLGFVIVTLGTVLWGNVTLGFVLRDGVCERVGFLFLDFVLLLGFLVLAFVFLVGFLFLCLVFFLFLATCLLLRIARLDIYSVTPLLSEKCSV